MKIYQVRLSNMKDNITHELSLFFLLRLEKFLYTFVISNSSIYLLR